MARSMTDSERIMFVHFMAENQRCWCCGWQPNRGQDYIAPDYAAPVRLENHHIVGGAGRKHIRENIARLCSICHRVFHGDRIRLESGKLLPEITLAHVMWMKRESDRRYYNPEKLSELSIRRMPDPEPPSNVYQGGGGWNGMKDPFDMG